MSTQPHFSPEGHGALPIDGAHIGSEATPETAAKPGIVDAALHQDMGGAAVRHARIGDNEPAFGFGGNSKGYDDLMPEGVYWDIVDPQD